VTAGVGNPYIHDKPYLEYQINEMRKNYGAS
jgi:hypothetical protein